MLDHELLGTEAYIPVSYGLTDNNRLRRPLYDCGDGTVGPHIGYKIPDSPRYCVRHRGLLDYDCFVFLSCVFSKHIMTTAFRWKHIKGKGKGEMKERHISPSYGTQSYPNGTAVCAFIVTFSFFSRFRLFISFHFTLSDLSVWPSVP